MKKLEVKLVYEQDSKRFHRYKFVSEQGIVGTLYIPKDTEGIATKYRVVLDPLEED